MCEKATFNMKESWEMKSLELTMVWRDENSMSEKNVREFIDSFISIFISDLSLTDFLMQYN